MKHGRGYRPDPDDPRDRRFSARRRPGEPRIAEVNEEPRVRGIRDQLGSSACVGASGRGAVELRIALDGLEPVDLSVLGAYYGARHLDGFQREDAGAFIRSLLLSVYGRSSASLADGAGIPFESDWPFDMRRVNDRPSGPAEGRGVRIAQGRYERIDGVGPARVEAILDALQARCPVILDVNADYLRLRDTEDTIPPPPSAFAYDTNHAVYLPCRFDRFGGRVRMVNSWGRNWADGGMCWLAPEWLKYARDAWALVPLTEAA